MKVTFILLLYLHFIYAVHTFEVGLWYSGTVSADTASIYGWWFDTLGKTSTRRGTRGPSSVSCVTVDPTGAFVVNLAKGSWTSKGDSCKCVPQSWENWKLLGNLASGLWTRVPAEGQLSEPLSVGIRPTRSLWTCGGHHVTWIIAAVPFLEVPSHFWLVQGSSFRILKSVNVSRSPLCCLVYFIISFIYGCHVKLCRPLMHIKYEKKILEQIHPYCLTHFKPPLMIFFMTRWVAPVRV